MANIVYALVNEAMPGLVKIGKTTKDDPEVRMNQLYTTGVPLPFECAIAIELENQKADELEKALHIAFGPNRLNQSREFFKIDPDQVEVILKLFPGRDVTPGVNKEIDKLDVADREAVKEFKKRRRPPLNFAVMGIPPQSTLTSTKTQEEATVISDKMVSFRGEEISLSKATSMVLELGYFVSPTHHWLFNGRPLRDIYRETYGDNA